MRHFKKKCLIKWMKCMCRSLSMPAKQFLIVQWKIKTPRWYMEFLHVWRHMWICIRMNLKSVWKWKNISIPMQKALATKVECWQRLSGRMRFMQRWSPHWRHSVLWNLNGILKWTENCSSQWKMKRAPIRWKPNFWQICHMISAHRSTESWVCLPWLQMNVRIRKR